MRNRTAAVLLVAAVGACSPGDRNDPSAAPSSAPVDAATTSSTPATAAADPFAVPEVIDAAYANRVLKAIYTVNGDVLRRVVASQTLDADAVAMLRAIYNDPQFEVELELFAKVPGVDLSIFKLPPGDRRVSVARLVSAGPDCISAEATLDTSEIFNAPEPLPHDQMFVVRLTPTQADADPEGVNPTPWSLDDAEVLPRGGRSEFMQC